MLKLHEYNHQSVLIDFTGLQRTLRKTRLRGTNASIGDALVDGTALKWEDFKPFDDLTVEKIKKLSATEVKERRFV